jgi:outer membrane protein assembly factor BamB
MPPTLPPRLALFSLVVLTALSAPAAVQSADWIHWRGPEQTGQSKEKNLPGDFDPRQKAAGNVLWQQPSGGRSAPLVMGGKLYIIQGTGAGLSEGEQVVCFDEAGGKKLWDYRVNVYHTDIVSSRLGWTTLTADPAAGYVYAHTTAGELLCLDKDGKKVWSRQLTEEFGRVTGYGGRIVSPIFDSGLVIVGVASSSWGDQARGLNRFLAFDGKTGQVVWITGVGDHLHGTYYSSPVVAVINGQRLLIAGGADGALHALKVRTGEEVWSYEFAGAVVNGSPVVSGTLVYCTHGEENPEGGPVGRVICVDAGQVAAKKPKLVWDSYKRVYKNNRNQFLSDRFGLASAALADGLLYCPSDNGEVCCFRAKDGELLWKYRYATEVRGSPLIADGKLYIFDVKARMVILTLQGEKAPNPNVDEFDYRFPGVGGLLNETNGTPIAVNGRVYFTTRTDLYCVGDPKAKPEAVKYNDLPPETAFKENAIAGVRLFPAEVNAKPGEKVQFKVVYFDENGREVKDNRPSPPAKWTLPQPPVPKGAKGAPPALQGTIEDGTLTLAAVPSQQGYVEFECGPKARARVRVVPQLPYSHDFEKIPPGGAPGGWVNTNGKFLAKQLKDGNFVLSKLNDNPRPPLARANGYITGPDATDYTIQADVFATLARDKLPDLGLVNCRYTLTLDGKIDPRSGKLTVRLVSWEARPRIDVAVPFDWKADTWYTMKFTVEPTEKSAVLRGKVWPKGEKEPEKWTIEFTDPSPNRVGAAALYGYVPNVTALAGGGVQPGSEIYYDNLSVTPNKK